MSNTDRMESDMKHPRPLVQGNSGAIYCTGCLRSAATAADLDNIPCYADLMED